MFKSLYELLEHSFLSKKDNLVFFLALISGFYLIWSSAGVLGTLYVGLLLAYLLNKVVEKLEYLGVKRSYGVTLVYTLSIGVLFAVLVFLLPALLVELVNFTKELPSYISRSEILLKQYARTNLVFLNTEQIDSLLTAVSSELKIYGKEFLSNSVVILQKFFSGVTYIFLVPIFVLLFMLDSSRIRSWCYRFKPKNDILIKKVWFEFDLQISNFIAGKGIEILATAVLTYIVFWCYGLNYSFLLAFLVGLSVLVPIIGIVVVTLPVLLVGFIQFGFSEDYFYLLSFYTVVQLIDGYFLVPYLFSEALNIHPLAILLAIVFFGGYFGIIGIFFAIPMAILLRAIINSLASDGAGFEHKI